MRLSAQPWAAAVMACASQLEARVEQRHPEVGPVVIAPGHTDVVVAVVGAPADRLGAAWSIAVEVAELWCGVLDQTGVGCEIQGEAFTVRADTNTMAAIGRGRLQRAGFVAEATVTLG